MKITVGLDEGVLGKIDGKLAFLVTTVDTDDYEDTISHIWLADSEDELYDLIKERFVSGSDSVDDETDPVYLAQIEELSERFDEDYGRIILTKLLGTVFEIQY
jgi:hypothetical protein